MWRYVRDGKELTIISAVPGELRGLHYVHENYGKLPWARLFQPAIDLARNGFRVSSDFARGMDLVEAITGDDFLRSDPVWAEVFAPNGTQVGEGDWIRRLRYAETLASIAMQGSDAFYDGPIAEATIRAIQSRNGSMDLHDLAAYQIKVRPPVSSTFGEHTLHACGVPASGAVTLSALNILDGFNADDPLLSYHRMLEAMRFAYGAVSIPTLQSGTK